MPASTAKGRERTKARVGPRGARTRWRRRTLAAALFILLLPFGLTLIYRPAWVHPVSTLMMADLITLEGYDRRWLALEEIDTSVTYAVMMSEDGQFCAHSGIDWDALNTVVNEALSGEKPRGASTIPMQTVKNLFLWPGRSFVRKALEVPLALYFDFAIPKRRIMEIYLNIAEWAPNVYGVEAAAQHYFGGSARDLSARQGALLAVTLPNPAERNPASPAAGLDRLAAIIEGRARQAGSYIGCLEQAG